MMSAKIAWPSLFSENLYIEDAHKYVGDAALFCHNVYDAT